MIVRVFRPTIHPGKEAEFEAFLRDVAIPMVSAQSGLVAQHVGAPAGRIIHRVRLRERVAGRGVHRAFAGENWEQAVITQEEEHLLKATWIEHYELLAPADPKRS